MAFDNFKKEVYSAGILRDLKKFLVLHEDCNHNYDGDIKGGAKVKIFGIDRPVIKPYLKEGVPSDIDAPEEQGDKSQYLLIDQADYFNIGIDDIDKAQSIDGILPASREEASVALAEKYELFIASKALKAQEDQITASTAIATTEDIKNLVDKALVKLRTNGVPMSQRVVIELTPWAYDRFENLLINTKTQNDELIAKGIMGQYKSAIVKMCNNMHKDGADDCLMVRTNRAIAAGHQIEKVEAYRPEKRFMDAIKGLHVYGAEAIRPEEIYTIKAHEA